MADLIERADAINAIRYVIDSPNYSKTLGELLRIPTAEQTEPQTERIKTLDYCDICNHKGCDNCIANSLDDYCVPSGYEPTTQTETQNSNLTFEKDECAKEYEELGLKELKELIKADHKTENSSEKPNNCDTCRNKGFEGCEQPCLGCGCCGLYEPKDEPQRIGYCNECKWFRDKQVCGRCRSKNMYAPKDEPQTERNK